MWMQAARITIRIRTTGVTARRCSKHAPLTIVDTGSNGGYGSTTTGDEPTTDYSGTTGSTLDYAGYTLTPGEYEVMPGDAVNGDLLEQIESIDALSNVEGEEIDGETFDLTRYGADYFFPELGVTYRPDTSGMTRTGLPAQIGSELGNIQGAGINDDVSRSAVPSPTATLIALAAAGRNPTDITLPTAGTEAVDPPGEGHEEPAGDEPPSGTTRQSDASWA